MKKKGLLYLGLLVLAFGILLNNLTESNWPIVFIVAGIVMKVFFIVAKISKNKYRPGFEMFILLFGLALFFLGLYLSSNEIYDPVHPAILKVFGVILKVVFIFLFLFKLKNSSQTDLKENKKKGPV